MPRSITRKTKRPRRFRDSGSFIIPDKVRYMMYSAARDRKGARASVRSKANSTAGFSGSTVAYDPPADSPPPQLPKKRTSKRYRTAKWILGLPNPTNAFGDEIFASTKTLRSGRKIRTFAPLPPTSDGARPGPSGLRRVPGPPTVRRIRRALSPVTKRLMERGEIASRGSSRVSSVKSKSKAPSVRSGGIPDFALPSDTPPPSSKAPSTKSKTPSRKSSRPPSVNRLAMVLRERSKTPSLRSSRRTPSVGSLSSFSLDSGPAWSDRRSPSVSNWIQQVYPRIRSGGNRAESLYSTGSRGGTPAGSERTRSARSGSPAPSIGSLSASTTSRVSGPRGNRGERRSGTMGGSRFRPIRDYNDLINPNNYDRNTLKRTFVERRTYRRNPVEVRYKSDGTPLFVFRRNLTYTKIPTSFFPSIERPNTIPMRGAIKTKNRLLRRLIALRQLRNFASGNSNQFSRRDRSSIRFEYRKTKNKFDTYDYQEPTGKQLYDSVLTSFGIR